MNTQTPRINVTAAGENPSLRQMVEESAAGVEENNNLKKMKTTEAEEGGKDEVEGAANPQTATLLAPPVSKTEVEIERPPLPRDDEIVYTDMVDIADDLYPIFPPQGAHFHGKWDVAQLGDRRALINYLPVHCLNVARLAYDNYIYFEEGRSYTDTQAGKVYLDHKRLPHCKIVMDESALSAVRRDPSFCPPFKYTYVPGKPNRKGKKGDVAPAAEKEKGMVLYSWENIDNNFLQRIRQQLGEEAYQSMRKIGQDALHDKLRELNVKESRV